MKFKAITNFIPSFLLTIFLLILWELVVRIGLISSFVLPPPTEIFGVFKDNWSIISVHTAQTVLEATVGLVIAAALGLATAILLDMSLLFRKTVYPLLVTSQTIPMIAIAPLLLVWVGFDLLPKVIIVVLSCFFPIVVATLDGFAKTDRDLTKLLKSMNANYWQMLRFVRFPDALPQFFSGLKIATTYSVTAAIVGEYVGAYQGLGIYMQTLAHSHAIALVFAAIFVTAVVTIALVFVVLGIERIILPWNQQ